MNEYHIVFSVLQKSVPWQPLAVPPLIAAAATFILGYAVWKRTVPVLQALAVYLMILLAVIFISGGSQLRESFAQAKDGYSHGHYRVIEGNVTNFRPMPFAGHKMETFSVAGVPFSYSDYILSPCFNNTTSHGGPIHDGLPVRISYNENCILKLEVADTRANSVPTR